MLVIAQDRRQNRDIFSMFFNMKVVCVIPLESPYRGDSNGYTQYIIFNIKRKIALYFPKSAAMGFFPGDSSTNLKEPVFEPLMFYCNLFSFLAAIFPLRVDPF